MLNVVDVERPAPGPEQALVPMKAAGINPWKSLSRKARPNC
jgi:NADPH:quinone reductase-like Zn-dependent oxidoreductase